MPEDEPNLAEEGRVIEYIEDGVPKLGLLLQKLEEHERESKSLWIVGSQDARKFALSQAKFSYVWPEMPQLGLVDGITAQAVRGNAKQLAALAKEAEDLRATIAPERLQALWEEAQLTGDSPDSPRKAITPVQAAQFLFGSTGPLETYAAHGLLWETRVYFKPRGKTFVCRDREMAEELKDSLQDRVDSVKHSKLFLIKMRHKLERAVGGDQAPSAFLPDIADLSKEYQACWKSLNYAEDRASTDVDLVAGGMDSLTEKQHLDFLKKYAAMIISETPSSEPIDVTEHTPLEGLLKEGANSVDLFNAMVQLGVFSEKENLDIILHRRPLHFPEEASTWVDEVLAQPPPDSDEGKRLNLRQLPVYTIDPHDAYEIDDGLSIQTDEDGDTWVYVHVADPTRWITPDSPLDLLARDRAQSLYLPNGVSLPLFPPKFTSQAVALRPNTRSCALTFAAKLDRESGEIKDYKIAPTLVENVHGLTYGQADSLILSGQEKYAKATAQYLPLHLQEEQQLLAVPDADEREERKNDIKESLRRLGLNHKLGKKKGEASRKEAPHRTLDLQRVESADTFSNRELARPGVDKEAAMGAVWGLHEMAKLRRRYREQRGAVIVSLPTTAIRIDDVAQHRGVRVRRLESKVTEEGANLGQEGASEEGEEEEEIEGMQESTGARMMVEELMLLAGEIAGKFAEARGIPIPFRVQQRPPGDSKYLDYLVRGKEKKAVVKSWKSLVGLPPTKYSSVPGPHFSLALDSYAQVTSPMRRYADVLAHHQIKAALRGEEPPFLSWHFVPMFQTMIQRKQEFASLVEVISRRWIIQYLKENKDRPFRAVVLEVQEKRAGGNLIGDSRATVLLSELGWRTIVTVPKSVKQGHALTLRVRTADPWTNYVSFFKLRQ